MLVSLHFYYYKKVHFKKNAYVCKKINIVLIYFDFTDCDIFNISLHTGHTVFEDKIKKVSDEEFGRDRQNALQNMIKAYDLNDMMWKYGNKMRRHPWNDNIKNETVVFPYYGSKGIRTSWFVSQAGFTSRINGSRYKVILSAFILE